MKKTTQITILFLLISCGVYPQQEKGIIGFDNWLNTWTEFTPNKVTYGEPTQILTGNITKDLTLIKRDIYLLVGDVFVTDSTTLTIEPGTVILGDFKTQGSLIISNGSKIMAEGKATDPIIFSSSRSVKKQGDWGGLFVLGDAPTNRFGNETSISYGLKPTSFESLKYGGENIVSNSGILRYIRIEYAGKRTKDFGYFSGLTLAGVGSKTILDNIMVSYSLGNSFTILGGDVLLNKMVSFRSHRNDYKFNYGTQTIINNSLAIRSPYISSPDGYRCMSIASYDTEEDADFSKSETVVIANNLTLVNVSENIQSDIKLGLVKEAIYIKDHATFSLDKSVVSGFSPAVILDDKITIDNDNLEKIEFQRTYFNNCNGNIFVKYNTNNEDLESWYGSRAFNNVYSKGPDAETFIDLKDSHNPDFRLRINKIIATTDTDDSDNDD